jgi:hypothetical protein
MTHDQDTPKNIDRMLDAALLSFKEVVKGLNGNDDLFFCILGLHL